MAENEQAPGNKGEVVESGAPKKAERQSWTQARCLKAARRFQSEEAWKSGAPSSYKAAVAHGWKDDCTSHMTGKVVSLGRKPSKAPAKQKGKKLPKSA